MKNNTICIFVLILLFSFPSNKTSAQNWFPLEIGNRWDFHYSAYCHSGGQIHDTISVEVVGDTILNGKKYFTLSRPFYRFDDKYLRVENDSLYCFYTEDSIDCLMYAFNQPLGTKYFSCRYDSCFYSDVYYNNYFGYPDTQQVQSPYYEPHLCYFSKKFGLSFIEYFHPLCDYQTTLSGCIISGITYGQLLVSAEDENNNPSFFNLEQNYPNPFNPSTKIKYSVPQSSNVIIKVFDILGNEIATLVNKEKPAGSYEVEFNAKNLPSGIYFYRLQAGSFNQTKKMLLLK